jgi:Mn2+/Fe2+ NRAMP family transporter
MPTPVPRALVSGNPLQWLRVFGPGAIIASLTIGTGELIFSSRGGAIFGYPILFPFLLICLLKWTLAYSAARHMVISGVHPLGRWMELPVGPRGWLTILFFLLGAAFIPVWVSFHSSILGELLAGLTGTKHYLGGASVHLWGAAILLAVFALAIAGGYSALEKTQLVVIAAMLAVVIMTLIWFGPNWLELLRGFVVPQRLEYPDWLASHPSEAARKIAGRPVWVELSTYVGVIGGAGYDYLAYTSYLRDKHWGNAAPPSADTSSDSQFADSSRIQPPVLDERSLRQWIRAPLIDCTLSFIVVLIFSAVFVAAGKLVLGPAHQVPSEGKFLEFQAQFVTHLDARLYWLYILAAFLTMAGTLYGTLEVAPTILRETMLAVGKNVGASHNALHLRNLAIGWCTAIALLVLAVGFVYQLRAGIDKPPGLLVILTPVNFFTNVLACGIICLLNPWMDRRLPAPYRMPLALAALNLVGGVAFILVALRAYWEYAGWSAMGILLGIFAFGIVVTWFAERLRGRR